ncbi:transposon Ty3-G Gag-Pol polyprotein [Trichonephila clavipes]|nr:transposon Ty3-G Gag-Pol polyprotein [Trichonephila clavipes]
MIADQMKKRPPVEFKQIHLDEWPSISCPVELAERLEEFEDVCRTLKQKTHTLTPIRRPEYDFVLDKDQYSLTWHVVPTKQLNFEAIIGTDILGEASLNFTQEGVIFHKHEEKACLMQISGVHPEDELDFSHILDSQVKNDLTRITSSYKPEQTESTDVTRMIIQNNDIPVYQPARRLSYAEKKSVNKHIEEWLEQGIVRPSSSEYASPIVLVKNKKTYKKRKKGSRVPSG